MAKSAVDGATNPGTVSPCVQHQTIQEQEATMTSMKPYLANLGGQTVDETTLEALQSAGLLVPVLHATVLATFRDARYSNGSHVEFTLDQLYQLLIERGELTTNGIFHEDSLKNAILGSALAELKSFGVLAQEWGVDLEEWDPRGRDGNSIYYLLVSDKNQL